MADAVVAEIETAGEKTKVHVIFFNHLRDDFYNHYAEVSTAECAARGWKKGDMAKVLLEQVKDVAGMFVVKGLL